MNFSPPADKDFVPLAVAKQMPFFELLQKLKLHDVIFLNFNKLSKFACGLHEDFWGKLHCVATKGTDPMCTPWPFAAPGPGLGQSIKVSGHHPHFVGRSK